MAGDRSVSYFIPTTLPNAVTLAVEAVPLRVDTRLLHRPHETSSPHEGRVQPRHGFVFTIASSAAYQLISTAINHVALRKETFMEAYFGMPQSGELV